MSEAFHTVVAFLVIFIAFILVPGLGGFRARTRWRNFRERVMKSTLLSQVTFGCGSRSGPLGAHRFTGRIEALLGDDTLLLKGPDVTIRASMSGSEIYLLPDEGGMTPDSRSLLEERLPETAPRQLSWRRITSLQEGSKVYVVGFLESKDEVLRMYGSREVPLLAILHEGGDVIPRSVWSGRQKHAYWNALTPWALLAGSMALFILATSVFRGRTDTMFGSMLLTAAFFPIIPLVPPGLFFFFIYLANWRRARFLRAEQDILGLSAFLRAGDAGEFLSGWGDDLPGNTVPLIRSCRRRALRAEALALISFAAGFGMNVVLAILLVNAVT